MYIERADKIVGHLQEQIEGLGTIYAQEVTLSIGSPAAVRCRDVFKVSPFAQPLGCLKQPMNLGPVEGRSPLSILLELEVSTEKAGGQIPISLEFGATIPSRQLTQERLKRHVTLDVVPGEPEFAPPDQILQAVQMLNLYRMNEKAWQELQTGNTDKATRRMQRLTTRLMEAGHTELAQQALMETQRLAHIGTLSLEGRKKLKYGTRTLMTRTMLLKEND
jgi:Ca-activated chloride channel family protein